MRAMGLDVGTKTVGIALCDELGLTAQPLITLRRTNFRHDLAALRAIISEHQVESAIVGLPLNMNGTEGPRAADSRKVGDALQPHVKTLIYWDERLTTVAAQRSLLEADVSRKKRKAVVDQVAAVLILQGWLDGQRPGNADYYDGDDDP